MSISKKQYDVCVVGGGLTGLASAVFLAKKDLTIALVAPERGIEDHRTTALLADSVIALDNVGIWSGLVKDAFPLKTMRIVDATNRLFRSPQVDFKSGEIGLEAFGYNLRNEILYHAFEQQLLSYSNVTLFAQPAELIEKNADGVEIRLEADGAKNPDNILARFVIGADGRNSIVRNHWNIKERHWSYPQSAVVFNFEHEFSSHYTSTEFHTKTGPFTIVPNTEHMAGLVWVETPSTAKELVALPKRDLALVAEKKMQSFLGKLKIISPPQTFPLSGMVSNCFGKENCALVGEAAHVFPPIGAQGFNLGIRDVQCIADILANQTEFSNVGEIYHQKRQSDITLRTTGVDLLNRTLLSDFLPTQMLRSTGLYALGRIPFLRNQAMQAGISGVSNQ